jgi:hypothetical protein
MLQQKWKQQEYNTIQIPLGKLHTEGRIADASTIYA